MALIVFLRGANVGGHRTFKPSELAKQLAGLQMSSHGAAGTFIVRGKTSEKALREKLLRALPFKPEVMVCSSMELEKLVRSKPFGAPPAQNDVKWFVSVLGRQPQSMPPLPLSQPGGAEWQVRVVRITGKYALSLWRRGTGALLYPNEVVEKTLGVPATTRGWNTILAVCDALRKN